jgi:hypothetical protein
MVQERPRCGLQQKTFLGVGKFCESGNELFTLCPLNHGLVARELPVQSKPGPGDSDQRVEPQQAKTDFMDQPDQVVAPSGVCQFVEQDGIEFRFCQ